MSGNIIDKDDDDKILERQQDQSKEKQDEIQELRKRVKDLEEKVEKKPETRDDNLDDLRRDVEYQKKRRDLEKKAESMKKDVGTITLVAVIGGIFGINGLGHFMIGKAGTGIGYLIGGIVVIGIMASAIQWVALIPWLIFLIASSTSARSSAKIWNNYIDAFVKEPTWNDIKKAIKYSKSKIIAKFEPTIRSSQDLFSI